MRIQTLNMGTWIYPDSEVTANNPFINLDSAKNSDTCFQILTDQEFPKDTSVEWEWISPDENISVTVYELRPVLVKYNTGDAYNAIDYEEVKEFVTRKAPFEVYDLTRPIDNGKLLGDTGKTAFFIKVNVADKAATGEKNITLKLNVGGKKADIYIKLNIHKLVLDDVLETPYPMGLWIIPNAVCYNHSVERCSDEYYHYVEKYLEMLKNMRCNQIMLPVPTPIRDKSGKVIDFDFSEDDFFAEVAVKLGFQYICSGCIGIWKSWRDEKYYLAWDDEVETESVEAYRQLKIYFNRTQEFITRNHLEEKYWQCVTDEPQFPNALAYKALSCTCKTLMPGVRVLDAVETTDITGACDIWIVKQAIYEKYKEQFDELIEMGEKFWVYSCGFPAKTWMNHTIDLPLSATRLLIWKGIRHHLDGFLHYGYLEFQEGMDTMYDTNWGRIYNGEMRYFSPGNHALIYTDGDVIYDSVRAHVQRTSAAEGEMFLKLRQKDEIACNEIIDSVCTSFEEYTSDASLVEQARKILFDKLDVLLK